jgi:hypothetical protein
MDAKELGNSPVGTVQGQPVLHPDTGLPRDPYSGYGWAVDPHPGITLRQHYAGLAMAGALGGAPGNHLVPAQLARESVAHADALLAELAKEPQP